MIPRRFEDAILANKVTNLFTLAHFLLRATRECSEENINPVDDIAVQLISKRIGIVGASITPVDLVDRCKNALKPFYNKYKMKNHYIEFNENTGTEENVLKDL